MSVEIEKIKDCLDATQSIGVAMGTGGIRLFSTSNKIWLNEEGVRQLIEALEDAENWRYLNAD